MLDPNGRYEIMETVKRLNKERNMTVVLITHYMEEAVEADRVIIINDGKIETDAVPYEVFPNVKKMKSLGLDTPQATELAYELKKSGFDIDTDVLTTMECADRIEQLWKKVIAYD